MHSITVIHFAGCPYAEDLVDELRTHQKQEKFSLSVDKVYRAEDALEKGLFGSPTIRVDGREYQRERRGGPGVYCRTFLTAEGIRNYPEVEDLLAVAGGCESLLRPVVATGEKASYPVLLLSTGCVFTRPAKNFWSKIADEAAVDLEVLLVENDPKRAELYGASGYPCLACGDGERHYGFHYSSGEAKKILQRFRK